jgi:hypothetical protein
MRHSALNNPAYLKLVTGDKDAGAVDTEDRVHFRELFPESIQFEADDAPTFSLSAVMVVCVIAGMVIGWGLELLGAALIGAL